MLALIVQHHHDSPLGPIGERLEDHGYELVYHQVVPAGLRETPALPAPIPDLTGFDIAVLLGAPWSVYDPDLASAWVDSELVELRRADAAGIPVLGICFGGQLLAAAHGGEVALSDHPEVGWTHVNSLNHVVPGGRWFQWHFDAWSVPPDATELASNSSASQAFVLRRNLAVQFHPELTLDTLTGWLSGGGAERLGAQGFDPEELLRQTTVYAADARVRAHQLVDHFLRDVAQE